MSITRRLLLFLPLLLLCRLNSAVLAADPGLPIPRDAVAGDYKPGSILFYNFYSSSATDPATQNTRVTITNTSPNVIVSVSLYFVLSAEPGTSPLTPVSTSLFFICLYSNQTATFLLSDVDPGSEGYLIAVASDFESRCPIGFNYLIGSADIKLSSGHRSTLTAQTIGASFTGIYPDCRRETGATTLRFDGSSTGYDRVPRVLVADSLLSRLDGNDTLLVLNRFRGSLTIREDIAGILRGVLYDESGTGYEFSHLIPVGANQIRLSLSNSFPATTRNLDAVIPQGRGGWLKISTAFADDYGLFGAVINFNSRSGSGRTISNGGQNLRALSLCKTVSFTIPFQLPAC